MIRVISDYSTNHPTVEGAGSLGDEVNKRWSTQWVNENNPQFYSFDQMAIEILVEDYNERHKEVSND